MLRKFSSYEARSEALLDAQRHVLELIVRGRALPEVLAELCLLVEAQAPLPSRAAILLVDESGTRLYTGAAPSLPEAYSRAIDGIAIDPEVGTCAAAAARRESVVTRAFATDVRWDGLRHLPLELGLKAAWSVPILSSTGAVLGTFGTYFLEEREPLPEERRLVEVLARTGALAIERQRADGLLRHAGNRHRFLAELAAATQPLVDPAEIMSTTARMLAEHLGVDRCAYAEVEREQVFVITGDYRHSVPSIVGRWPVAAFGAGCVQKMKDGEPFVVHDVADEPTIGPEDEPAYHATNIAAVICVPLHKQGRFTAAMAVHQRVPRRWLPEEIDLVTLTVARCWEALERARVTRDLTQSEARYRAMVEASPECVKLVAADGTLLQMNAAGLSMVEASAERAIGCSVYDVIAPEHRERFRAFNERVCRGEGGSLEFDIVGLRGTRRVMETKAVPLPAPEGGHMQLAVTRDVTARVQANRALALSRARLDYAVRLSGVGFWYCDLPFDELNWDARVKAHFFLPPDARVTIDTFYERIHPDDRALTRTAIEESIQNRGSYDVVYRTVDPDTGAIKWVRALGGTAYGADGTPTRFDGVTVDVSEQRRDEERLARALERERAQGRLLQKVAHAALTIHASGSLERVLHSVTEEARSIIGAHRAETHFAAGERASQAVALSDAHRADGREDTPAGGAAIAERVRTHNRALRTARDVRAGQSRDAISADGSAAACGGWLAAPLVARDGTNLGVVALSDKMEGDFDEVDEAILVQLAQIASVALENARLYEQLREQDQRKSEFLATLAHELRNPLAPIRTGLELLRSGVSGARADKAHDMMTRQLGHMVRMVDDLLDISRITLGKVTLQRQRVDFRVALESALETTRTLIQTSGHTLTVHLPDAPLLLDADPTRLSQVLANLVSNAAKYTPSGGRIDVAAEASQGTLVVRVRDTGVGIPTDMLGRVFEMFTQVGHSLERSQGGLGIGLTLVRSLMALHGGSVTAHSDGVGTGTTFTLRFPLLEEAPPAQAVAASAPDDRAGASSGVRVLVVDDNVDGAESLGMLIELHGHEIQLAHTGPDALAATEAFHPHVVFLDIGLPGLSGYEVAMRIRANPALPQPTLYALTGWGSEDDRRRAREAGFDRHLVKPFDPSQLEQLIGSLGRA